MSTPEDHLRRLKLHSSIRRLDPFTTQLAHLPFNHDSIENLEATLLPTLLCDAVLHRDRKFLADMLDLKADINSFDYDLRRPIHIACSIGDLSIVKYLVEMKADVNIVDSFMYTPLDDACESGNEDVIRFVRESGGMMHISTLA